jgi:2-polyprenyl-6-hydroxyphenyl methylase/3-demethylubiquinone-9 3-methyltransferase
VSAPDTKYDQKTHFAFGKNWAEYSATISEQDIASAKGHLLTLLGLTSLDGKSFLDIGCGSGIHALAALRSGAEFLYAVDIDPDSVATTKSLLKSRWPLDNYRVEESNVFTLQPGDFPRVDIVYSWGVLHHTGDMWAAIDRAAALVRDDGLLAIAIYRKTRLCGFWKWEKRFYTGSPAIVKKLLLSIFIGMKWLRDLVRFKNPLRKMRGHSDKKRGMKWYYDAIDWLGGYPYESASPEEIEAFLAERGFSLRQSFKTRKRLGLYGTGNAEYLFARDAA